MLLKNVPYNFGQFGRAECLANHTYAPGGQTAFIDSVHHDEKYFTNNKRHIEDDLEEMADKLTNEKVVDDLEPEVAIEPHRITKRGSNEQSRDLRHIPAPIPATHPEVGPMKD